MSRVCEDCEREKEEKEFLYVKSKYLDVGDQSLCILCKRKLLRQRAKRAYNSTNRSERNKQSAAWREKNPKRKKKAYRRWHVKSKYGLDLEQYDEMFAKQDGCCAICGVSQSQQKHPLCVDHCHRTGKVRALLCRNCNFGLGQFKDSPELLKIAAKYIKGFRKS
jgi:hypothetical protein